MRLPLEVRRGWEHRFPDLFGKWTHWKIMGDEYCVAIVEGANLTDAIKVMEENYGKYVSIKACRATVDQNGDLLEEEQKALYEISNYPNDEKLRKRYQGR